MTERNVKERVRLAYRELGEDFIQVNRKRIPANRCRVRKNAWMKAYSSLAQMTHCAPKSPFGMLA